MTEVSSGVLVEPGKNLFDPSGHVIRTKSIDIVAPEISGGGVDEARSVRAVEPGIELRRCPSRSPEAVEFFMVEYLLQFSGGRVGRTATSKRL